MSRKKVCLLLTNFFKSKCFIFMAEIRCCVVYFDVDYKSHRLMSWFTVHISYLVWQKCASGRPILITGSKEIMIKSFLKINRKFTCSCMNMFKIWSPLFHMHWKKKWSYFYLKCWVTGGAKVDPILRVKLSIWFSISSNLTQIFILQLLVPPVTQLFRLKWLHFFLSVDA